MMSPNQEGSRAVDAAVGGGGSQSLDPQVQAKDQAIRKLEAQLAARSQEAWRAKHLLALILSSRSYRWARALAKTYACVRHPRVGITVIRRKIHTPRPVRRFWQLLSQRRHRMAELAGAPSSAQQAQAPSRWRSQALSTPHFPIPTTGTGKRVCIVIQQFFDEHGENMFCGGAERYLIELERLSRDLGYEPEVYQSGASHWVRNYHNLRVIGLDTGGNQTRLNQVFHSEVPPGALTIYLAFSLAAPLWHPRSIGVSHGIYWDDEHALANALDREMHVFTVIEALEHATAVVSVDTSTINWVRGTQVDLAQKLIYIPNFVDTEKFRPSPESKTPRRLVVLYPRRLCRARGFWLFHDVLPELAEQYPQVDFHLVGKADAREEAAVRALIERYSGRVRWYSLPPERMSDAYRVADISIIPTVHSEGTSLSCLEAQASGNAVIATTVGGLTDLVGRQS
jgi:glycosyltransferase involved in cell wall biosynthesis